MDACVGENRFRLTKNLFLNRLCAFRLELRLAGYGKRIMTRSFFKKLTQNNVEQKVNEIVKAHEKKLKLKALQGSQKLQRSATKTSFSHPVTVFLICLNYY